MMLRRNVLGGELKPCSEKPMTGWFRNGCCDADRSDPGLHVICVVISEDFLKFSQSAGNDLSTPRPEFSFPGLKPGDQWCLCANRWKEAWQEGCAPFVDLESTHEIMLEFIPLEILEAFAI